VKKSLAKKYKFCYNLAQTKEGGDYVLDRSLLAANNILDRARRDDIRDVTPMKLQKLLYFLYASYLCKTGGSPLFSNRFEAWEFGPVNPAVYNSFSDFRGAPIDTYAMENGGIYVIDEDNNPIFKESLDEVWEEFKNHSAAQLSRITHQQGTAWANAVDRGDKVLRDEEIRADGERILKNATA